MTRSNVAGYVAGFPIPEVLQGINAFTLGMRAANPRALVKVLWLNTWFDPVRERVTELIAQRLLYVADKRQSLHFQQVFLGAKRSGYLGTATAEHVAFGRAAGNRAGHGALGGEVEEHGVGHAHGARVYGRALPSRGRGVSFARR